MSKVFLSHSSLDKKDYVKKVAESLIKSIGIHNVVYDEFTFEKGMMPLEEIDLSLIHIFNLIIASFTYKKGNN